MSAGGEIETHKCIARLQQSKEHSLIGLAAGIRLHIGEFAIKQPAHALNSQCLGNIDKLAATIITPARIALGIFVGQDRTLRLKHSLRDDILGCYQFDLIALAVEFLVDRIENLGIDVGEARSKNELWAM